MGAFVFHRSAKALIELTASDIVWQGANADARLRCAFIQFRAACKAHGVSFLAKCGVGPRFFFKTHLLHQQFVFLVKVLVCSGNRGQMFSLFLGCIVDEAAWCTYCLFHVQCWALLRGNNSTRWAEIISQLWSRNTLTDQTLSCNVHVSTLSVVQELTQTLYTFVYS